METLTVWESTPSHELEKTGTVFAMLIPGYRPDQPTTTDDGQRVAYTVYIRGKWQTIDPRQLVHRGSFLTIRGKRWRINHEPEAYENTGGAFIGMLVQIDEADQWGSDL